MTGAHEALCAYLAEHDEPCPNCGYNLRGLAGDRCPECSQRIELGIRLAEARLALWVAGIVGLAAGLGFFGVILCVGVYQTIVNSFFELEFFAWFGVPTVLLGASLALWLRQRRRIRSLPPWGRVCLTVACWILPIVCVGVLVVFMPII